MQELLALSFLPLDDVLCEDICENLLELSEYVENVQYTVHKEKICTSQIPLLRCGVYFTLLLMGITEQTTLLKIFIQGSKEWCQVIV